MESLKNSAFKRFTVVYTFNHSKMGFNNSVIVIALNEAQALENAKNEVSQVYGSKMLKRFSFKNQ